MSVSFGNVVILSGKAGKIRNVNEKLREFEKRGDIFIQNVTSQYENASTSGVIASQVQKGNQVSVYVTKKDLENIKQHKREWDTISGILSNMKDYFDINRTSLKHVINEIFKK